jgi:lipoprotein-anchoring transpeptidase ErfK/SrfK
MRMKLFVVLGALASLAVSATASLAQQTKTYWSETDKAWVDYTVVGQRFYRGLDTSGIKREEIAYNGPYQPKTIVVNTAERRLYYIDAPGHAIKYGVGVGREGFAWSGSNTISRKAEWPGWTPPPEMIKREAAQGNILPAYMPGGEDNPLGARALYIGETLYRIHGTREPWTIGQAVSSGCIRMINDDVIDLYNRVSVGTRVVVIQ